MSMTEVKAGLTTFLAMSYIIFVNPMILSAAGMDKGAVFTATCVIAILGSLLMAVFANYPMAIAPAMSTNAYFAYTIVQEHHIAWQHALGMVFVSGILFLIITLTKLRVWFIRSLSKDLAHGITAGIGLFIAVIALKNAGIIMSAGHFYHIGHAPPMQVILFLSGFIILLLLDYYGVAGAMLISIVLVTLASLFLGLTHYSGLLAVPPSIKPGFMQFDLHDLWHLSYVPLILIFLMVSFFDSIGTLISLTSSSKDLLEKDWSQSTRFQRALVAENITSIAAGLFGTSTASIYLENATGIKAGGRSGLTALVVALLFLLVLFFSPVVKMVPAVATAPALLYIAILMFKNLIEVNFNDITAYIPALLAVIFIPLSFSITNGIGIAFIVYLALKLLCGKVKELHGLEIGLGILFVAYFAYLLSAA